MVQIGINYIAIASFVPPMRRSGLALHISTLAAPISKLIFVIILYILLH